MRTIERIAIGVIIGCIVLIIAFFTIGPASGTIRQNYPPECIKVNIVEQSGNGPTIYANMCGTGNNGDSPLVDRMATQGPLIVDGSRLNATVCTKTNRCVILATNLKGSG